MVSFIDFMRLYLGIYLYLQINYLSSFLRNKLDKLTRVCQVNGAKYLTILPPAP